MSSIDDENSSTSTSSSSVPTPKPVMLRASMLRPSAFKAQSFTNSGGPETTATGAAAEPTANPFAAAIAAGEDTKSNTATTPAEEQKEPASAVAAVVVDPLEKLAKSNGLARSNPFTSVQVKPLASDSGFVFGQNTRDRVTGNVDDDDKDKNGTNGTDLTFSSAAPAAGSADSAGSDAAATAEEKPARDGKSLSDVAREYEETKNARKRKFEEVETFTGEENETNVMDVTCKLYTFSHVYEERGRGSLRLNDVKGGEGSRLVFRTAGSLRVLLNTKVWAGMIAEPASPKSLRITGIDAEGQVKIYLVMARPSDIQSLTNALQCRITAEKVRVKDQSMDDGEQRETQKQDAAADDEWATNEKAEPIPAEDDDDDEDGDTNKADGEEAEVTVPALKKPALEDSDGNVSGSGKGAEEANNSSTSSKTGEAAAEATEES